jgi:hypothetical protein
MTDGLAAWKCYFDMKPNGYFLTPSTAVPPRGRKEGEEEEERKERKKEIWTSCREAFVFSTHARSVSGNTTYQFETHTERNSLANSATHIVGFCN